MTSYEKFQLDFRNKKILVMGLGIQGGGVGVVRLLQKIGAKVIVTDIRSEDKLVESLEKIDLSQVSLTLGGHEYSDFDACDYVIRNPGIPSDNPFLTYAKSKGKKIYMETALFAHYADCTIVGITGTRGKTTTSILVYEMLKKYSGKSVALAGNIPGSSTLELLESLPEIAVLELSSWQLQGFDDLRVSPHIAVLTNIYPDHLNRYNSMEEYANDKAVITKYQVEGDYFVYNQDDSRVNVIAESSKATRIPFSSSSLDASVTLKLPGRHNRANASAADKVGELFGVAQKDRYEALSRQESIPYRLETVAIVDGVTYINDTTSTTPVALTTALATLTQNTVIIVGGQSKKLPTDELVTALNNDPHIRGIILIPGTGTNEIKNLLDSARILGQVTTLEEAVSRAKVTAKSGETILFSPGFTSFDQYRNEFERGAHFNQIVATIKSSQ